MESASLRYGPAMNGNGPFSLSHSFERHLLQVVTVNMRGLAYRPRTAAAATDRGLAVEPDLIPIRHIRGMRSCWSGEDDQLMGGPTVTVVVRSIPTLTFRYGTRMA
jgi:hypothetical protein